MIPGAHDSCLFALPFPVDVLPFFRSHSTRFRSLHSSMRCSCTQSSQQTLLFDLRLRIVPQTYVDERESSDKMGEKFRFESKPVDCEEGRRCFEGRLCSDRGAGNYFKLNFSRRELTIHCFQVTFSYRRTVDSSVSTMTQFPRPSTLLSASRLPSPHSSSEPSLLSPFRPYLLSSRKP